MRRVWIVVVIGAVVAILLFLGLLARPIQRGRLPSPPSPQPPLANQPLAQGFEEVSLRFQPILATTIPGDGFVLVDHERAVLTTRGEAKTLTKTRQRLPPTSTRDDRLAASPDGKRLLYRHEADPDLAALDPRERSATILYDLTAGTEKRLSDRIVEAVFTEEFLVYVFKEKTTSLVLAKHDGSDWKKLFELPSQASISLARLSPKRVLLASQKGERVDLEEVELPGGRRERRGSLGKVSPLRVVARNETVFYPRVLAEGEVEIVRQKLGEEKGEAVIRLGSEARLVEILPSPAALYLLIEGPRGERRLAKVAIKL